MRTVEWRRRSTRAPGDDPHVRTEWAYFACEQNGPTSRANRMGAQTSARTLAQRSRAPCEVGIWHG
eukprot:6135325-Pleurochrysis_carterae.AAC.1